MLRAISSNKGQGFTIPSLSLTEMHKISDRLKFIYVHTVRQCQAIFLPKMFWKDQRDFASLLLPPLSSFNQIPQPSHRMPTAFQTAGNVRAFSCTLFAPCSLSQLLFCPKQMGTSCLGLATLLPPQAPLPAFLLKRPGVELSSQPFSIPLSESQVKV